MRQVVFNVSAPPGPADRTYDRLTTAGLRARAWSDEWIKKGE